MPSSRSSLQLRRSEAKLVARIAAERIAPACECRKPLAHAHDHLVGHIETEGIVDEREIVDRDEQEGGILAATLRCDHRIRQRLLEAHAIEKTGQLVIGRQPNELFIPFVPFVDRAQHTDRTLGRPVGAAIPATAILDPAHAAEIVADLILEFVSDAVAGIAFPRPADELIAARPIACDARGKIAMCGYG